MNRRDFLKTVHKILVMVGGSSFFTIEELEALEVNEIKKPDLVWLHGMSCDGCSTSLLNSEYSILDVLTHFTNIVFHPTVMAATGKDALNILNNYKSDNLVLVVEGGIPIDMPHACIFGDRYIKDVLVDFSKKANLVIASGTCATFGGICAMDGMQTGVVSLKKLLEMNNIKKPLIN